MMERIRFSDLVGKTIRNMMCLRLQRGLLKLIKILLVNSA